jgi:hypothetical protein
MRRIEQLEPGWKSWWSYWILSMLSMSSNLSFLLGRDRHALVSILV